MSRYALVLLTLITLSNGKLRGQATTGPASRPAAAPGFCGVWYEHKPKAGDPDPAYSGGLATFSEHHVPMAVYAEKARKTFFAYGGSAGGQQERGLQVCVAVYDHAAGTVSRPTIVVERAVADPHGNPALCVDGQGHVWVFAPGVAPGETGLIFRSTRAYDISMFDRVKQFPFGDPQPWYVEGKGLLLLFSRAVVDGTQLWFCASTDPPAAEGWSEPARLTPALRGCRAVSGRHHGKVGVVFNYHPASDRLGGNPYYMETPDAGRTWTTAQREKIELPVQPEDERARVFDYASAGQAVALKDLNFDSQGNPTVLLLISRGATASPQDGSFTWMITRWVTRSWRTTGLIQSDHLMDAGCLFIETRNSWRIIAPTTPGAEPGQPGGEVVSWFCDDFGRAWSRGDLTHASDFNHNHVRRPLDAQPDFYAFWADGAVRRPSESLLYFATRDGKVFRLPTRMAQDTARPELVPPPIGATLPASQGAE